MGLPRGPAGSGPSVGSGGVHFPCGFPYIIVYSLYGTPRDPAEEVAHARHTEQLLPVGASYATLTDRRQS